MRTTYSSFLRTCIVVFGVIFFASPMQAQLVTDNFQASEVVANEVLVKFRQPPVSDGLAQARVAASIEQAKATADIDYSRAVGGAGWLLFHSRSENVATLIGALSTLTDVVYVEPNFIYHPDAVPSDSLFSDEWGFYNTGQAIPLSDGSYRSGTPGADVGAVNAWNISTGTPTISVGVIDTGIDYTHPDLSANVWSAPYQYAFQLGGSWITCPAGSHGWNAVNSTCDPINDADSSRPYWGHGTHVAGTIGAATGNSLGVAGVNWNTRIISCKFEDGNGNGPSSAAIDCMQFMRGVKATFGGKDGSADIRVLNNSWGCTSGNCFSQALLDEIWAANRADMLFVASAGNDGNDNDSSPRYPANYSAANVVSVAAFDNVDNLATNGQHDYFSSNYGASTVHLGGPGVVIVSTLPGGSYGVYNGTSMAAPHVSGTAALSLAVCEMDTDFLKPNLLNNVVVTAGLTGKTSTGGRVNAYNSLRAGQLACPGTGYAKVNGTERHRRLGLKDGCDLGTGCPIVYDSGTVSMTVNGLTKTAVYDRYSTAQSVAEDLQNAMVGDGSYPARAHVSGSNVSLSAKTTGAGTCYPVSGSYTYDDYYFTGPSFTVSSVSALVGCR